MLFIFPCYYPSGGAEDLRGVFETIEEAIDYSITWCDPETDSLYCETPEAVHKECYMHIYDLKGNAIVRWKARGSEWSECDYNIF